MPRVLVVDDDLSTLEQFSLALRRAGCEIELATTGRDAIHMGLQHRPDAAIIDLRLPDMSGLDVLKELRQTSSRLIMMTGFATTAVTVAAMRLGAENILEKPVDVDRVVSIVTSEEILTASDRDDIVCHAAARVADVIVRAATTASSDPKTIHGWGTAVAAAPGTIRNWCATSKIKPKRALDFMRVLRAVIRQRDRYGAEDLLDVVDRRTLNHLLALGREDHLASGRLPSTPDAFIQTQRWISEPTVLQEVRRRLGSCR